MAGWFLCDHALRQSGDCLEVDGSSGDSGWDGVGVAELALSAFLFEEAGEV